MNWQLAQVNIAKARFDITDERMAAFVDNLERINDLGDRSPGFVWRYQTDDGDATAMRIFDDPDILLNLTVWESPEALREYVFKTEHVDFLRRRREWFESNSGYPTLTLWWVPAGVRPAPAQAKERAEHLRDHGPSERAFTYASLFPPPSGSTPAGGTRMTFDPMS